jgi:hypothetical protein
LFAVLCHLSDHPKEKSMRKMLSITLLALVLLALPAAAFAGGTPLERAQNAGWQCADIAGAWHCFDPGDMHSQNSATVNVKVYDYDGSFLGTEQLWRADLYAGQPCPQDHLIDLGAYIACHHYSH